MYTAKPSIRCEQKNKDVFRHVRPQKYYLFHNAPGRFVPVKSEHKLCKWKTLNSRNRGPHIEKSKNFKLFFFKMVGKGHPRVPDLSRSWNHHVDSKQRSTDSTAAHLWKDQCLTEYVICLNRLKFTILSGLGNKLMRGK